MVVLQVYMCTYGPMGLLFLCMPKWHDAVQLIHHNWIFQQPHENHDEQFLLTLWLGALMWCDMCALHDVLQLGKFCSQLM